MDKIDDFLAVFLAKPEFLGNLVKGLVDLFLGVRIFGDLHQFVRVSNEFFTS